MKSPTPLIAALVLAPWLHVGSALALPFDATAVELVAFTDYQCPFCARAEATVDALAERYGAALRIVVKHQPLPMHEHARTAAEAAEAARLQGRFEAMHDRLFAEPGALAPADLVAHARAVGLDVERFERDRVSDEVKARVSRDQAIANSVGATGTPTFFINGRLLKGAQPREAFEAIIDEEIAEARRVNRRGDTWISDRLSANNAELWGYLRGGQIPPRQDAPEAERDTTIFKVTVDPGVDAIEGPADAPVTLVVFSDYQCPFCARLEATLAELERRYPGRLRRVAKHNPLSFHEHARPAAAAAICAQAQGRFREMHESLFSSQEHLTLAALKNRASVLGLDLARFERCLRSATTEARIVADQKSAARVGARGTPTTFINGRKLAGAQPIDRFVALVEEELARAEAMRASGVRKGELYDALIKDGELHSALSEEVVALPDDAWTPILGNPKARVRITVFADLQCPFCARALPVLEQVVERYEGKVALAWKHQPLSFHEQARAAAKAALCAHDQRRFWEAARHLLGAHEDLAAAIPGLAEAIGLDPVKYLSCMNRDAHGAEIESDVVQGLAAGVKGTPTIFIQGRKLTLSGGYELDAFVPVIDELLARSAP